MGTSPQPSTDESPFTLDRTYMAATRTLLAVVRTGAVIAGGGTLVTQLLVKGWPRWVVVAISSAFVVLGYALIWSALKRGRKLRERLERVDEEQSFLFPHRQVTAVTVALQVLIATVVVLYLISQ